MTSTRKVSDSYLGIMQVESSKIIASGYNIMSQEPSQKATSSAFKKVINGQPCQRKQYHLNNALETIILDKGPDIGSIFDFFFFFSKMVATKIDKITLTDSISLL